MVQPNAVLLSTACFAPVQYFSKLILYNTVYIEQYEHFPKQTFRNRYEISGANGLVSLVIPVVKGRGGKKNIRDIKISYDSDWQRNHWRTIFSAYNSSPFFEYYKDDIFPFFETRWKCLFDYNLAALQTLCDLMELETIIHMTPGFEIVPDGTINLRMAITPKRHKVDPDEHFNPAPYTQVFSGRFGFMPNLSILDLLFNEGPNSINILETSCTYPLKGNSLK
jgi:hypothetical protein